MGWMWPRTLPLFFFLPLLGLSAPWVLRPDEVAEVAWGGEVCLVLQDDWGFLGAEGWASEEPAPLCVPAPRANALLRVEAPGERFYHLKVSPSFEAGAPERLFLLVVFGEYQAPEAVPQGKSKAYYLTLAPTAYRPFGSGLTDVPGLQGWIRVSPLEGSKDYQLLLRLHGPALGKLTVGSLTLYRDGLEVGAGAVKTMLFEVQEEDGTHVYGGAVFSPSPGLYEARVVLVGPDGQEAGQVLYRFSIPREKKP